MMPIPSHLKNILIPHDTVVDEEPLVGDIQCRCGSNEFSLMYPGRTQEYEGKKYPSTSEINGNSFFLVKAVCSKCRTEYLLFDKDFHGSDGFLCHDIKTVSLTRPPLIPWNCISCGSIKHKVEITICSPGKEVFMNETKGEYDEERWPDAFEWITISIECTKCGTKTERWVDYETM